ncbi:MAG: GDSL-type esterase/lipase family protein [Clostridiaceae bacterium]
MKIVALGDSLTFGYGVPPYKSWVDLLNLQYNSKIVNKGINGDTSFGLINRFYEDVICEKPDKLIITIGCNDLLMGRDVDSTIDNIKFLIEESSKNNISTIVGITPPIVPHLAASYWEDGVDYDEIENNLNIFVKKLIDFCKTNKIQYVDFFNGLKEAFNTYKDKELYSDGIHPTELGHKLMYEKITNIEFE